MTNIRWVLIDQNIQIIQQTSVGTDNALAVSQGLSYISSQGHKNVGILLPTIDNSVLQERCDAVFQYSAITGFPLKQELWLKDLGHSSEIVSEESIDRIALHLTEHPEITALFAFQYPLAVAADQAARRIRRTTGKDLSILCFDSPLPLFGRPQFTHLHQDEAAIGEKAVELLLELISHPVQAPQNVKIPAKLVEGESFLPYNLISKVAGAFDKLCQPLLFLFTDYCKQLGNRRGTTPGHIEGILRLFTPKSPHQTFCHSDSSRRFPHSAPSIPGIVPGRLRLPAFQAILPECL